MTEPVSACIVQRVCARVHVHMRMCVYCVSPVHTLAVSPAVQYTHLPAQLKFPNVTFPTEIFIC